MRAHGTEPLWQRTLVDRRVIIITVILVIAAGYWSTQYRSDALARSGAVVSALGFLLMSRGAILRQTPPAHVMIEPGKFSDDPGYYISEGKPVPPAIAENVLNASAWNYGAIISAFGTLLWGFGDLPFLPGAIG